MNGHQSLAFEMTENNLNYEIEKSILICTSAEGKKRWAKKIHYISMINDIIEDESRYFISCETDDIAGRYLVLYKDNGSTLWHIPGNAYLQVSFEEYLYLIFIDSDNNYFLIKVDKENGHKIWHHRVYPDLSNYSFAKDRITLDYSSGKQETISPATGVIIQRST